MDSEMHVMIIEDNNFLRNELKTLLRSAFNRIIVSEASEGRDALKKISEKQPDVVITDVGLAGKMSGLELTRMVKTNCPATTIIVHTEYDHAEYRQAALNCGSDYFLGKGNTSTAELVKLIESIASGNATTIQRGSGEEQIR